MDVKTEVDRLIRYGLFVSIIFALAMAFRGVVLMFLWAWFVMPATGFPAINVALATGLVTTFSLFSLNIEHFLNFGSLPNEDDSAGQATRGGVILLHFMIKPLFLLLFGWIVQMLV